MISLTPVKYPSQKIVGLIGPAGSGRRTVANLLVEKHGFGQSSIANTIKDVTSAVFGLDRARLEGCTNEAISWRNQYDSHWEMSPATTECIVGTKMHRLDVTRDFWIKRWHKDVMNSTRPLVLTDVRTAAQASYLRSIGGTVVYMKRNVIEDKIPCSPAAVVNRYNVYPEDLKHEDLRAIHPSEWCFHGLQYDLVIANNGSLQKLEHFIDFELA